MKKSKRSVVTTAGAIAAACAIAACGSSSANSGAAAAGSGAQSGTSKSSSSTGTHAVAAYKGVEAHLPHLYPKPVKKSGVAFTVGFLNPNASIMQLSQMQHAAAAEASALGGRLIGYNGNFSINTQVSQFNDLLAQHVNAIIADPLEPSAFTADIKKAAAAHIPVIGITAPLDLSQPPVPGYITNVTQGNGLAGYDIAAAVARVAPGSTFAILGNTSAAPTAAQGAAAKAAALQLGLKFSGEVDTSTDDSPGGATAMAAILSRYPNVGTVFTYNETAAMAAVSVARSRGDNKVRVASVSGGSTYIDQIAHQGMPAFGTVDSPFSQMGREAAYAANDELTKQHLPLPREVPLQSKVYTIANAKSYPGS